MRAGKPVIYWDSGVLIAWVRDEKRDPGEMDGVFETLRLVETGKLILVTSTLWRVEVLDCTLDDDSREKLNGVFKRRHVVEISADLRVMGLAGDLRNYYQVESSAGRAAKIKTPDAIHLAAAIHYEADEFHTFDGVDDGVRKNGLLALNGNVAGRALKIVRPYTPQFLLPLSVPTVDDDSASEKIH